MEPVAEDPGSRTPRDKFVDVYQIAKDFHLERETIEVNGNDFHPVTYLGTLTQIVNGNELIRGRPGAGKTTSSEALISLCRGIPLENVQNAEMEGNAEADKQELIGMLDIGKLQAEGESEVMFQDPAMFQDAVLDEINRLTPATMGTLLNAVDRNIWSVYGETVRSLDGNFYATANRNDSGNVEMPLAIRDRFSVSVDVSHPGHTRQMVIDEGGTHQLEDILDNQEYADDIRDIVEKKEHRKNPLEAANEILEVSEEFQSAMEEELSEHKMRKDGVDYEVLLPRVEDHLQAREQALSMPFSDQADRYLRFLNEDLNLCEFEIPSRCDNNCSYADIPAHDIGQLAQRATTALRNYAKAAAYFDGSEEVNVQHVRALAPYVLNHRAEFRDEPADMDVGADFQSYADIKEVEKCREIVEKTHRRFREKQEGIQEAHQILDRYMGDGRYDDHLNSDDAVEELEGIAEQVDDGKRGYVRDLITVIQEDKREFETGF